MDAEDCDEEKSRTVSGLFASLLQACPIDNSSNDCDELEDAILNTDAHLAQLLGSTLTGTVLAEVTGVVYYAYSSYELLPRAPADITVAATINTASGITGFTLPGMMLLPGCRVGSWISPSPASGPLFIQRRSLQILLSATASVFSSPDSATAVSWLAIKSKRRLGATK